MWSCWTNDIWAVTLKAVSVAYGSILTFFSIWTYLGCLGMDPMAIHVLSAVYLFLRNLLQKGLSFHLCILRKGRKAQGGRSPASIQAMPPASSGASKGSKFVAKKKLSSQSDISCDRLRAHRADLAGSVWQIGKIPNKSLTYACTKSLTEQHCSCNQEVQAHAFTSKRK